MKKFCLFLCIFLSFNSVNAGSFSTVFGSEGSSTVTSNPKTRSLAYSLQYLAFSGVTGFFVKQLFETGFFEPLGFVPDSFKELSPLAYDKSKSFPKVSNLNNVKNEIYSLNDSLSANNMRLRNSPSFVSMNNQKSSQIDEYLNNKEKRDYLIRKYFNE